MRSQCPYFPHKGMFKDTSTTKLPPVFDASCKDKNSRLLNDCSEESPNLLEQIIPIILRFRKHNIGVISDTRKVFLQMSVNKSDQDFLRFLWWKDFDKKEFRLFRHKRVVFGLNCSPFLLASILNHHIYLNSSEYPETAENSKESFHVDNYITSVPDEETLSRFIEESKQILSSASFDLRRWEHTPLLKSKDSIEPTPVLEILWDKEDDSLFCDVKTATDKSVNLSRRNILSAVHRVFDPMGFLCSITLTPKLLIQKTWLLKISWDANILQDLEKGFCSWIDDLSLLSCTRIPRALDINGNESLSLHTFWDAKANINSRPLTYESQDSADLCVLTPSMFIQDVQTEGVPDLDSLDKISLSKRWRYHQKLRVEFRKRFRDEYLGLLVHRPKTVPSRTIKKGGLAFAEDDRRKRTDWPMGRVIETYPGKDNSIRVAKVKTSSSELLRRVQRIFLMETKNKEFVFEFKTTESSTSSGNTGKKVDIVTVTKDYQPENSNTNVQFSRYGRKIVKPKSFS
ncbi:hypothetical protein X975_05852, partial [Stegodyphus mimosarum]